MNRWELGMLTAVLALAFSMEQADVGVLQSMYSPIARSLGCSAVSVGTLTTWRGVVQVGATLLLFEISCILPAHVAHSCCLLLSAH